jgi:sigma54-dependent transcription regulator
MDDDLSLYAAGGSRILRLQERLLYKQEKVAGQQQQMFDFEAREKQFKRQTVSTIKRISTEQGGKPLTTANIASALSSIATTVTNRINQMAVNTTKQFLPIDSQLKQINDLIASNTEGDIDKGFEMIDRLQSRLGIDLGKYSKEIGDAVQKLYDMNRQRKEDRAEAKRIQVEKTEELTRERDILRERGINTYVNEKTLKLEIKSKKEERLELKRLQDEEKKLKQ